MSKLQLFYEKQKTRWRIYYKSLSLRQIIWISFTCTALITTGFMGISFYGRFSSQLQQTIQEENEKLIEQVGNNCASYLRNIMKVSDTIYYSVIRNIDIGQESPAESFRLLYETNKESIESIAFVSSDGRLLESAPAANISENIHLRSQDWYVKAVKAKENIHFGSPFVFNIFATTDTEHTWSIPLSRYVKITENGRETSGVLLINLRYDGLSDIFSNVLLGSDTYLYLMDSQGEIVYHPFHQLVASGYMEESNESVALLRDGNHQEVLNKQPREITIKTIGYTGWRIVGVTTDESFSLSSAKNSLFTVFLVLFLGNLMIYFDEWYQSDF